MEDKESTSSSLQSIRYAYMEMIKGPNRLMRPLKVLTKMSERPRSRLLIWAMKRFIIAFKMMLSNVPSFGLKGTNDLANETSQDYVSGLISWVTLDPIPKFEIALNLSYFGVLHNKEEGDKVAGFLKIFEKVISEELVLRKCNERYMGSAEPPEDHDYMSHEFSPSFTKLMGATMKKYLENKGKGSTKWLSDKIYEMLANKDILEFATMKASATKISVNATFEKELEMNKRRRTTEAINELLRRGYNTNIMADIDRIEREVQQDGGVTANLFKKMQIGGTREIFVLSMQSRILVNLCESICRCVCEELPNEMLTKGDQKMLKNDTHFRGLHNCKGDYSTTVSSSDDATTWAQRFVMPVFASYLCNFLEDDLMIPISCVLNHCTNKRLELPKELLTCFLENPNIQSFSENINELKKQFTGQTDFHDLVDTGKITLKNRSNMMQGILHYTSSLLHSGFLILWQSQSEKIISNSSLMIKDYVITTKVSSDDSSVLISTKFNKYKDRSKINMLFHSLTILKSKLYKYISAKQSVEKSTVGVFWTIEEFNSIWLMRNTLIMPLIKFVVSSTQVHTSPRIESRLYTSATLRSQILENCGSIFLSAIIQVCQARLHYITLGALNNKLWNRLSTLILMKPHPTSGFFTMEPDICCGLLGVNYANYLFYKRNHTAAKIQQTLFKNFGVEYSKEGEPTSRVILTHGQNEKYYKFLKELQITKDEEFLEDLNNKIGKNVQILYRKAETTEESLVKLIIKSSSPELSQAFSYLTSSKAFASASYVLQEPCFHLFKTDTYTGKSKREKTSLIKWAKELRVDDILDEDLMKINFPSWQFYDNLEKEISTLKFERISLATRRRRVFISIPIPKQSSLTPMSLIDCCKRLWFNLDIRGSEAAVEATFDYFRKFYPWLRRNYDETLEESPFDSHVVLYNFLISLTPQSKTIRLTTPSRVKHSGFNTIIDAIVKDQWPRHELLSDEVKGTNTSNEYLDSMLYSIWLAKNSPPLLDKIYMINKICKSFPDIVTETPDIVSMMTQGVMRFNTMILQSAVIRPTMTTQLLQKYNKGVFGGFIRRQEFDELTGKYVGFGIFAGSIDGLKFSMDIEDTYIRTIITEDVNQFILKLHVFRNFINDLGLTLQSSTTQGHFIGLYDSQVTKYSASKAKIEQAEIIDNYSTKNVIVKCDDFGRIRIMTEELRPITIMSFVPSIKHIPSNPPLPVEFNDDILNTWMHMESIEPIIGLDLLSMNTTRNAERSRWVYVSFMRRLKMRGFQTEVTIDRERIEERNSLPKGETFNELLDDWGDDLDEVFKLIEVDEDSSESESFDEFNNDIIYDGFSFESDNYATRQPIKMRNETDVFQHHKFWDKTIEEMLRFSNWRLIEMMISDEDVSRIDVLSRAADFINHCKMHFRT